MNDARLVNPSVLDLARSQAATLVCVLRVPGIPGPQGSKRHVGGGRMVESSKKVKPWRSAVALTARDFGLTAPVEGALEVSMVFYLPRPASVPATDLRRWHRLPATVPDLSKLARSTEDALSGIVWVDDRQVVGYRRLDKRYAEDGWTGVHIAVWRLPDVVDGVKVPRW